MPYLDANGNPISSPAASSPKVYLNPATGEPVGQGQSPGFFKSMQNSVDQTLNAPPTDSGWRGEVENFGQTAAKTLLAPVLHPVQTLQGVANAASGPVPGLAPAIDEATNLHDAYQQGGTPRVLSTAAGQVAGGALQGGLMKAVPEVASTGASAVRSAADATGLMDGPPESLMTQAMRGSVNKNNVNWASDVKQAVPLMKSAEPQIGRPIQGIDDALAAAKTAKQSIWQQYQARLNNAGGQSATIDGNEIADAMQNSVDKRTALQNPQLADKVKQIADTYRRPIPVQEAEEFLQSANRDLTTYYAKNKVGQQVAQADPETAYQVAETGALRDALYSKMDDLTGPGSAQLKQAYGSLSNVQKVLADRQLVAARQAPQTLPEQLGFLRGVGKIAKSAANMEFGDAAEGVGNMVGARWLAARNSSDAMITRAFQNAPQAQPFPASQFRPPLPVGHQLPAQSGAPTILPYNPQMTPGEQVAAAMQAARQNPQLALPASAGRGAPTILPTSAMTAGEKSAALMQYLRQRQQLALPAKASPLLTPPPPQQ
jgi:hypothetical protein